MFCCKSSLSSDFSADILLRQQSIQNRLSEGGQASFSPGDSIAIFQPGRRGNYRVENNCPHPSPSPSPSTSPTCLNTLHSRLRKWDFHFFCCWGVYVSTHALEVTWQSYGQQSTQISGILLQCGVLPVKTCFKGLGHICLMFKCLLSKW